MEPPSLGFGWRWPSVPFFFSLTSKASTSKDSVKKKTKKKKQKENGESKEGHVGTFKQDRITYQHLSMHLIKKKNEMVTWMDAMRSHPLNLATDVLQAALRVRDSPTMRDQ